MTYITLYHYHLTVTALCPTCAAGRCLSPVAGAALEFVCDGCGGLRGR